MVAWDDGHTLAERFRSHAGVATHLYGHAMRAMADDWAQGGVVRTICAGHENAPSGSALPLRLLAGMFRLVLTDRAPQLRAFYPCLGGQADPAQAWPVLRDVMARHVDELRAAMDVPPQTNEVGRSAALLAGLFDLAAAAGVERVRLLELGASAGLNLLVDQFRFVQPGWAYGAEASPVRFAGAFVGSVRPVPVIVDSRAGCDLRPVDATDPEGQLLLTSFVWPFDVHRHERLAAALSVAAAHPVRVDRAAASGWLGAALAGTADGVLPVAWHSVTRLYWPAAEIAAVEAAVAAYGRDRPVGRVALEFGDGPDASSQPELETTLWRPGRPTRHRRLGTAHHHGPPVRLAATA